MDIVLKVKIRLVIYTPQLTFQDFGEMSVTKDDNVSKGEDLLSLMDTLDSD